MEEDIKILEEIKNEIYSNMKNIEGKPIFKLLDRERQAIENLLQENKCSKETINILTNKLEKVVEENKKYKRLANKNLENEIILREKNAPEDIYVLQSRIEELEAELDNVVKVVNKYGGEQLRKYLMELSRFLGNVPIDAMLNTIKKEFIPISVIQNKIDELTKNEEDRAYIISKTNRIIYKTDIIDILQELLEERNK